TGGAHAARHEDLHVIGAAAQVLPGAATDAVHAVVARQRAAVPVVGGQAAPGHEQPRTDDDPGLDGLAHLHVDEVLLAHDPHRGGARRVEHRAAADRAGRHPQGPSTRTPYSRRAASAET